MSLYCSLSSTNNIVFCFKVQIDSLKTFFSLIFHYFFTTFSLLFHCFTTVFQKDQRELLRRRHGRGKSSVKSDKNGEGQEDKPHEHHNLSFRSEKFKIMLTFIQIFSQFKKNYGIRWPFLTSTYMRWLSSFNLDIIRILPVDCLYQTNYYDVLMATILMPFAVLVVCAGVSAIGRLYVFLVPVGGTRCVTFSTAR